MRNHPLAKQWPKIKPGTRVRFKMYLGFGYCGWTYGTVVKEIQPFDVFIPKSGKLFHELFGERFASSPWEISGYRKYLVNIGSNGKYTHIVGECVAVFRLNLEVVSIVKRKGAA